MSKKSICEYNVYKVASLFLTEQYNSNSAINDWERRGKSLVNVSDGVLSASWNDQLGMAFLGLKKSLDWGVIGEQTSVSRSLQSSNNEIKSWNEWMSEWKLTKRGYCII